MTILRGSLTTENVFNSNLQLAFFVDAKHSKSTHRLVFPAFRYERDVQARDKSISDLELIGPLSYRVL